MQTLPDHPDIAKLERDGCPEPEIVAVCSECGGDIYRNEWYAMSELPVCADCARSEVIEAMRSAGTTGKPNCHYIAFLDELGLSVKLPRGS